MNNCNVFFNLFFFYKRLVIKNKTSHTVAIGQRLLVKIVYVRRLWSWLEKWESTISRVSWKERVCTKPTLYSFLKCWLGSWLQFVKHLCWDVLRFFSGIFYSSTLPFFFQFYLFHSSFYFSLAMQLHHPLMSPFSPLPSIKCPRSVSNGEEDWNSLPVTCV